MPHRLFVFRPTPIGRNDLFTPSKTPIFNSLLSTNTHMLLLDSASCISLGYPHILLWVHPALTLGHFFTGSTYTVTGLVVLYD